MKNYQTHKKRISRAAGKLLCIFDKEPIYHSFISDELPELHSLKNEEIFCDHCDKMVHAFNNECMCPWFEFVDAVYCVDCYYDPVVNERPQEHG